MDIVLLSDIQFLQPKEATYTTILSFAKQLMKKGHNVCIICRGNRGSEKVEKINGVQIYRANSWLTSYIIGASLLIRSLQKKRGSKFDIAHNFGAVPLLSLKTFLIKMLNPDIKTVNTLKSYSRNSFLRFKFLRVLSKADMITVPTQVFKGELVRRGVPKKKISVIKSGINTSKFKPEKKSSLKKKYGLSGKKVVLYYGGLYGEKGLQHLIKSIPIIKKQHPDMIFTIAPRSPLKKAYGAAIPAIINLKDKLLVKNVDNIIDYINMADVVVLPYESMVGTEGNPLCLLESMACKTVVVTSRLPELKEIVEDKKDVLMAQPGNFADIGNKVSALLSDSKLREKLAESSYKKSKKFSIEEMTNNYLKAYSELVG